ncbi:MAG: transcription-repair coupling factor [Planctomycetota bacterium]|nr:transcription-repair coupling factor [Planctomycetota bacterium]
MQTEKEETQTADGFVPLLVAADLPSFPELDKAAQHLKRPAPVSIGNLWGSAQPLVLSKLMGQAPLLGDTLCIVLSTDAEAESFALDMQAFGADSLALPSRDPSDPATIAGRLEWARTTSHGTGPHILVASILALLQPLPALKALEAEALDLAVGETLNVEVLLKRLVHLGYERVPLVENPGEVSLRGDILDLYPYAVESPIRIEMFDAEIESLRSFDAVSQLSVATHKDLSVCLIADTGSVEEGGLTPLEFLRSDSRLVLVEPLRINERGEALAIRSPAFERAWKTYKKKEADHRQLILQTLPGDTLSMDTRSVVALEVGMEAAPGLLAEEAARNARILITCHSKGDEARLVQTLENAIPAGSIETRVGTITKGFRIPAWNLIIIGHHELKGIQGTRRRVRHLTEHKVKAIQSFFELKRGDYVVHAVHGLALYRGLKRMKRGGGEEEHLHLSFADDVSLFVPTSRIDMVQRFVGARGAGLKLDKIGGTAFRKRKEKVERGLFDMASDLIEVQAKRALRRRTAWAGDEALIESFNNTFPYEPTPDQKTSGADIAENLSSEKPMDRMLCGDVGFGKTEMAVRAAFRVVAGGGQVAVLVPTTVLADQHYRTFCERMADFPVRVEVSSRYVSAAKNKKNIEDTAKGEVDILVGTHRILGKKVSFKNLGLVIIDEEQRFGVVHKEHFKRMRSEVDILTLTATPIPRTLHMSLAGLRDISALSTPPPGRQPIQTILGYREDDPMILEALERELARGGQVYFLHNRVQSIELAARRISQLMPGLRIAIGHGQMSSTELRGVMRTFAQGEADILVATTIIENGIDIPSAGTILIDDADHFGLAELHQLRGRVGRGERKSYCYLLVEKHKPLKDIAKKRLKALEELSHLGAGFGISIKDLELRGAGNILGAQQSGQIAAVGYDMYCRLLRATVERLEGGGGPAPEGPRTEEIEAGVEVSLGLVAFLPDDWIEDPESRLEILRELTGSHTPAEVEAVGSELHDRFGRLPEPALTLLRMFQLKTRLDRYFLDRITFQGHALVIQYHDPVFFETLLANLKDSGKLDLRRIKSGVAHLIPPRFVETPLEVLKWLEDILPAD